MRNGARVCKWGDNVVNAVMAGDGWRKRHDSLKLLLRRLLVWAGIPVDCEVFNLFASSIPQDGLNRLEGGEGDRAWFQTSVYLQRMVEEALFAN